MSWLELISKILTWPVVFLIFILLFRKSIATFLNEVGTVSTKWFKLERLERKTEDLTLALKNTLKSWVFYIKANKGPDKVTANKKFEDTLNEIADSIFKDKEEKISWFTELGAPEVKSQEKETKIL